MYISTLFLRGPGDACTIATRLQRHRKTPNGLLDNHYSTASSRDRSESVGDGIIMRVYGTHVKDEEYIV